MYSCSRQSSNQKILFSFAFSKTASLQSRYMQVMQSSPGMQDGTCIRIFHRLAKADRRFVLAYGQPAARADTAGITGIRAVVLEGPVSGEDFEEIFGITYGNTSSFDLTTGRSSFTA